MSVIVPVFNNAETLDRALTSVRCQRFENWELIAIDDGSSDSSVLVLEAFRWSDDRVRLLRLPANAGAAAARNAGIAAARGSLVAYLDADDEYNPEYLGRVVRVADADVVVSGYDVVYDAGTPGERSVRWDPSAVRHRLFEQNVATPLGVVHRRELADAVGGFNDLVPIEADWDFWKRLARAGARFVYIPGPAGRYYVRPDSLSRQPHVPAPMRERILANRAAGRPLYEIDRPASPRKPVEKVAFASAHCLIDSGSGAAIATLRTLQLLRDVGFECHAFCGPRLDIPGEALVEEAVARQGWRHEVRRTLVRGTPARLLFVDADGIAVTIFLSASTVKTLDPKDAGTLIAAYEAFLDAVRPDVMVTYGGDPATQTMARTTKRRDVPIVFGLHNFSYDTPAAFFCADYVTVPSEFTASRYWDELGLHCHVLPNVVDGEGVRVARRRPKYVVFVNPQPTKGVYVFFRIAAELARLRPEIPFLVVESRGQVGTLREVGLDIASLRNVQVVPNTPRPVDFYEEAMVMLAPSLWNESFGLVAAEAMMNGIPVLASDRGALPEVVGSGGFILPIPSRYSPNTGEVPSADEIAPWVETILHLWDDPKAYAAASDRALRQADRWHSSRLAPIYREFFANLAPQPVQPLAPPGVR